MRTIHDLLEQARQEEFVSVQCLAVLFGVSERTIIRRVVRRLPGIIRVGRQYRIPRDTAVSLFAEEIVSAIGDRRRQ